MTENSQTAEFGVTVWFEAKHALVDVRGTVNNSTARSLAAFFNAVIASGSLAVVVELEDVDTDDALAIRVLTHASSRLSAIGGELVIRSLSPLSRRLMNVPGFDETVHVEPRRATLGHLGIEQTERIADPSYVNTPWGFSKEMKNLALTPANDDVVDGALRLLVGVARVTVRGADGASVSLLRHGRLGTVAASDQTISDMDASQYATGEGPCVDASLKGRWFHAEALDSETRWPMFTPQARALGINAILSSPLLAGGKPVGALNIYSRSASAFALEDQELASVFATEASQILSTAGVSTDDEQLSRQIGRSLQTRRVIAQAEGIIMARRGLGEDEAYTVLRTLSQRTNQPLRNAAEDVVLSINARQPNGDTDLQSDDDD